MQEPHALTATKYDQFRLKRNKGIEVRWQQLLERWALPKRRASLRVDKHVAVELLSTDADPPGAIAGNAVAVRFIGQKFHGVRDRGGRGEYQCAHFGLKRTDKGNICGQIIGFAPQPLLEKL